MSHSLQVTAARPVAPAPTHRRDPHGLARRRLARFRTLATLPFMIALASPLDSLAGAGVFGRGANDEMLKALRAVVEAMTSNMLGFVGATIGLVVIGLGAAHIYGDERAHEKTLRVVKGIFYLVIASGFVA